MEIQEYIDLIPSANRDKPNFIATIEASIAPILAARNAIANFPTDYDIDTAIGAQLDVVGEWVGLSRKVPVPITDVYFSFGVSGVGFGEGVWLNTGDPTVGVTSLDDGTYRALLKLKIMANSWNGSFEDMQAMLNALHSDGTYIFAMDNFDMSVTFGVSGKVPSKLFIAMLKTVASWLKPSAVSIKQIAVTSKTGTPIFGFGIQNERIAGFGYGSFATKY